MKMGHPWQGFPLLFRVYPKIIYSFNIKKIEFCNFIAFSVYAF